MCDWTWWKIIWKKECVYIYVCVCVCVSLGHFAIQQKLTEHCKSTIIKIKNNKNKNRLLLALAYIVMAKWNGV